MDVRKIGIWMVAVGGAALSAGLVADAVRHADDASLASKEGIFDLASFPHALFFGGIAVAVLGVLTLLVGTHLYQSDAHVTVGRRLAQVAAPLFAVALIAGCAAAASSSGLGEGSGDTAAAAEEEAHTHGDTEEAASTDTTHSHGDTATASDGSHEGHDMVAGEVIPGTAMGDSPCEIAQPTPASPGQVGGGGGGTAEDVVGEHGHRGMVMQASLTKAERDQLAVEMQQARTVVDKFPTVAAAEAGGYNKSTPYVPCIGAHYTNVGLVAKFDPSAPSELLYDGTNPDSKLVGLSYLVLSGDKPPEGFAGTNDPWHQHNANGGLCFARGAQVIGGEELTEAECTARGGTKRELEGIWMMHAWVVPGFECSWGVFAGECPELGGRTAGTAWDAPDPNAGA